MMDKVNFWISSIIKWEKQRYDSFLSSYIYSSLQYRQKYLSYIVAQFSPGASVVEIGCGTGRLYETFPNKNKIKYTGYDISAEAIAIAKKKYPDADWHCCDIGDIEGIKADYLISAGLLDWVSEQKIQKFLSRNDFSYHIHSFSTYKNSISKKLYDIFSYVISKKNGIRYKPRFFNIDETIKTFGAKKDFKFTTDKKLSFGAFIHSLPASIKTDFSVFKVYLYFNKKMNKMTFIESIIKKHEFTIIQKNVNNLKDKSVLEIGSGAGFYTSWLLKTPLSSLTCIDKCFDTKLFVSSQKYDYIQTSLEEYNTQRSFDVIFVLGVLEFVYDLEASLTKIISIVRPGAKIVILTPKENSLTYQFYKLFHKLKGIKINSDIENKLILTLNKSTRSYLIDRVYGGLLNNLIIVSING